MTRTAPAPTTTRRIERRPAPPVDPVALATAVATAYVEVRAGRRPPDQLRPLLAPTARRRLKALVLRRRGQDRTPCGGASVIRVTACRPTDDAAEVVVVLREATGVSAVAVRADRRDGRWWVTDVGAPQDRQPLVPPGAPHASTADLSSRDDRRLQRVPMGHGPTGDVPSIGSVRIRDTSCT